MNEPVMLVVDDSSDIGKRAAQALLKHEQAMHNIKVVGAMHSIGLPLELAPLFGAKPFQSEQVAQVKTAQDLERIAAAEAKRQRRAAKHQSGSTPPNTVGRAK